MSLPEAVSNAKLPASRPRRMLPHAADRAFLPAALEIIETPPSPVAISLLIVICTFVVAALAWCWFGRLDMYATARGKFEPTGRAKVVQPLETGKVAAIHVKQGQTVHAGDVMFVLDASEVTAEIAADTEAMIARRAEALRRQAVLSAVASGGLLNAPPPAIRWPEDVPEGIRAREEGVLAGDLNEHAATLAHLVAQRAEKKAAVEELDASIAAEQRLIDTLNERVELRQTLIERKVGTRTGLIDAVQALREAQTQLATQTGKRIEALAAVETIDAERQRQVETFVSDNTRKLAEALRLADEKAAERAKALVKLDRMTLRAPLDGIVQALVVTTLGQVVTTGQQLMRLVPLDAPIEIQAYVTNNDIGFVSPGQQAVVKIDSFPFSRHGTIEATVEEVAKDAIPAETANRILSDPAHAESPATQGLTPTARPMSDLVFEARLKPSAYVLDVNGRDIALSPGMTVTVEIKTGSRRIIEYLFSPLVEVAGRAMRER
jgi:hemolysin D